jgi:hypothetical protein
MASATGTYTGNGGTNRTIALAFDPKFVVVHNETDLDSFFSNANTGTFGQRFVFFTVSQHENTNALRPALTTNGFIVSGNTVTNTNVNAKVYYYFASG